MPFSVPTIGVVTEKELNGYIVSTLKAAVDNITIAYGMDIENAIDGVGNDTLIGNILDNQLTGGNTMESEIQLIGISESFKKT